MRALLSAAILVLCPCLMAAPATSDLRDLIELYDADSSAVARVNDMNWSATRFERMEKLTKDWQGRLAAVDFDVLGQQGKIDYLLLRNSLQRELNHFARDRQRLKEMDELLAWRERIEKLQIVRWRMEPLDPQAAASSVAALPEEIKKLRARIEKAKKAKAGEKEKPTEKAEGKADDVKPLEVSPLLAKRAAAATDDLRGTLKGWFEFYDGFKPEFSWWLKKPYEETSKSLEDYAKFLREEVAGIKGKDEDPILGEPIGADALRDELATEMIPYTPTELIEIGEKQMAWCEAEYKKAARAMGFGDDWKKALAKVKTHFVPPGEQDKVVIAQAREAVEFVKQRKLVTVPPLCEETWRLAMLSPEKQKTIPYAAYGGQNVMVAYAKEEMKHEDKLMAMRGNNRHFMHIVIPHELIPGHHLQNFQAARHRPYRQEFSTPFFTEGWSLYWETRLWDLGYGRTPEDRIGMLFWRMHRAARIVVSLKFHLGQMKPQEMIDFLIARVGHEKLGATSEVRRFVGDGYSPLYQCGYMIGGLQLRALHDEMVRGGKMREQEFNDTVLSCGAIPISLIRAGMEDLPLTRDSQSAWKLDK